MFEQFQGQDIISFLDRFPDDNACKEYLYNLKFTKDFKCPKCGHNAFWEGPKPFYKVCKSCRHAESPTANTLFHKVKFGLRKAFIICFQMTCTTKSMSSVQMAKMVDTRQMTAWYFMSKVRKAMASSKQHPMEGAVEVDEFCVGGKEEGKPGRSRDVKKTKAVIAMELSEAGGVKRLYIRKIEDYSSRSLRPLFDDHISREAEVRTDGWTAYQPLKQDWQIEQEASNGGKNFNKLHLMISQVKSWLRCIPTHVQAQYAQSYFDEHCFRINRSQHKDTIFHKLIHRMIAYKTISCPIAYKT